MFTLLPKMTVKMGTSMTLFNRTKREVTAGGLVSAPEAAASKPPPFETVLGANSDLDGSLRCSGNVRLDGSFSGSLEIEGNVLVGETATITADINANHISIAGKVRGNVSGKRVQVLRTGRIEGNISARSLAMEDGAFIDGKITMLETPSSPEQTTPPPPTPPPSDKSTPDELPADIAEALEMPMEENKADEPLPSANQTD